MLIVGGFPAAYSQVLYETLAESPLLGIDCRRDYSVLKIMPDKRKHRGSHPDDAELFSEVHHESLRTATAEYSWLISRGYATASALKLVGDRHGLTVRQRLAVMRSACPDDALSKRLATMKTAGQCRNGRIAIDGYNVLITVESALSGGLIIIGRDGCFRDLASIHGTYRKVEETISAIRVIVDYLGSLNPMRVDWYLDSPVSNSGRLKALLAGLVPGEPVPGGSKTTWNIELHASPDAVLAAYSGIVGTSDSAVLDKCNSWHNIAAAIIEESIPTAWKIYLS